MRCPYRKPTQVDEERILRPTGERLLRNSAKLPRNFGRRGAVIVPTYAQEENSKANGRRVVKELGKLTP